MRAGRFDRKKSLARDYALGRSRPHLMEVLEPRLLLSADTTLPGITDGFDDGLHALGHAIQEFIEAEPLFDSFVPGVIKPGSGKPGEVGPTIGDLFRVHNDRNQDDKIDPLDRLLSKLSSDGAHVTFEDLFDETFRHRIRTFLDDWEPLTEDPDETNEDDVQFVEEFALFLAGPDIDSENMDPQMDLEDVMDLEVELEGYSFDGVVAEWSITFSLGIIHDLTVDLDEQAGQIGISASRADATDNGSIEVTASITLPMTFVFELSGAESEQFTITSLGDMTITVEITEEGLLDENGGFINIFDATFGFIGIPAPSDFSLSQSVTTPMRAPDTPDFLGLDMMSLASSSNSNGGDIGNSMPRGFELDYDTNIFFMLTFNMSALLAPDLTPENGDAAAATDIDALKEGLKNAIDDAIEAKDPVADGSFDADLADTGDNHDSGARDEVAAHDDESDDLNNAKSDASQVGADNVHSRADHEIDWASDSNGNTVPFSPLGVLHNGSPSIPQLAEFLFALPERGKADLRTDENGDTTDELDGWFLIEHTSQDVRADDLDAKLKFRPYGSLSALPQTGVPKEPRTDNVQIVAASVLDEEEGLIL